MDGDTLQDLDNSHGTSAAMNNPTQLCEESPAKRKKTDNTDDVLFMKDMTSCLQTVASAAGSVGKTGSPVGPITTHQLWANLLVLKIDKMPAREAEDFKIKVDSMAVDLMDFE